MTPPSIQPSRHRWTKRLRLSDVSDADLAARLASISGLALRVVRALLLVVTGGLIACLSLLASDWQRKCPRWLEWLGSGSDWVPVVLVAVVIALLCILTYRLRRTRSSSQVPVMIVIGLASTSFVLGFSSYWRCTNAEHPTFITPLLWTVSLVKGGIGDVGMDSAGLCPKPIPAALEVARITIV